jgi:hypothetical protein
MRNGIYLIIFCIFYDIFWLFLSCLTLLNNNDQENLLNFVILISIINLILKIILLIYNYKNNSNPQEKEENLITFHENLGTITEESKENNEINTKSKNGPEVKEEIPIIIMTHEEINITEESKDHMEISTNKEKIIEPKTVSIDLITASTSFATNPMGSFISEPKSPEKGEKFKIRGYIKDATTNLDIPGKHLRDANIKITYVSILKNREYIANVNDFGIYDISLPIGNFVRNVTISGYADIKNDIYIFNSSTEENAENIIYLSPHINGWRAILTWGAKPLDLDARLITPEGEDIYWGKRKSKCKKVTLDCDAKRGFGPETISMNQIDKGIYRFYVKNFSMHPGLNISNAKVMLYQESSLVAEVSIPTEKHTEKAYFWNVFEINAKKQSFKLINKVQDKEQFTKSSKKKNKPPLTI